MYKNIRHFIYFLTVMGLSSSHAWANDSTASLDAGGIQLQKSQNIRMLSEDLHMNRKQISVDYVFENESDQSITTLVAFPMPELMFIDQDLPTIDMEKPNNFLHFRASVEGKPVAVKTEVRAFFNSDPNPVEKNTHPQPSKDITELLKKNGLLLNPLHPNFKKKLNSLDQKTRREFIKQGLLSEESEEQYNWVVRITLYWEQEFPAHSKIRVHHDYVPAVATSLSPTLDRKEYCTHEKQSDQVAPRKNHSENPDDKITPVTAYVGYVLMTATNWKGPIDSFHLTIDKENPTDVMAFCLPGEGLTVHKNKTSVELIGKHFVPKKNLNLGFIVPYRSDSQ